jgi:hypothetical protein
MAQELEIYKLLVTLAAALIAVSITAYSIAISVLGSERVRYQAQIDDIQRRADDRIQRGEIRNFKAEEKHVDTVRADIRKIGAILSRLSIWNVVALPGIFFAGCIFFAMNAILVYPRLADEPSIVATSPNAYVVPELLYWQRSALCLIIGAFWLVVALYGIEKAAGQPRAGGVARKSAPPPSAPPQIGIVGYFFVDDNQKLLVDWSRKIAYLFDDRIDQAARQGKIRLVTVTDTKSESFVKDNHLNPVHRSPSPEEV